MKVGKKIGKKYIKKGGKWALNHPAITSGAISAGGTALGAVTLQPEIAAGAAAAAGTFQGVAHRYGKTRLAKAQAKNALLSHRNKLSGLVSSTPTGAKT